MVLDSVYLMLAIVWMGGKISMKTKRLGKNGLIILFSTTEAVMMKCLENIEYGSSLCGTSYSIDYL